MPYAIITRLHTPHSAHAVAVAVFPICPFNRFALVFLPFIRADAIEIMLMNVFQS